MSKERSLKEYLNALPKQQLTALLKEKEPKKIISINHAVDQVLKLLADPQGLASLYDTLPPPEREPFRFLLLRGSEGADVHDLKHFVLPDMTEEQIQKELSMLQTRMLVYGIKSTPLRFFVFRETREALLPVLMERAVVALPRCAAVPPSNENETDHLLLRDTVLFLLHLLKEPIRKTKVGTLNRKQMDHWEPLFSHRFDFSGAEKGALPFGFQMILEAVRKLHLIGESESEIALSDEGQRFLELSSSEQAKLFYAVLSERGEFERLLGLLHLLDKADAPLERSALSAFMLSKDSQNETSEWEKRAQELGLIQEFGCESTRGWRVTSAGRAFAAHKPFHLGSAEQATVLPTFEILSPKILRSSLQKMLFLCCEIVKCDAFISFKLTKESLYQGFEKGVESKPFLELLETVTEGRLPQNVRFSIEEWVSNWGGVAFEMPFLLRVKKGDLYDRVKGALAGSSFILEEFPAIGFSVKATDYTDLFSILSKLGFNPKPFKVCNTLSKRSDHHPRQDILTSFLRQQGNNGQSRPIEPDFLMPDDVLAGVAVSRPSGRKYGGRMVALPFNELVHVINYAMLMEHSIEVEVKNGERIGFQPLELALHLSEPKVTGVNPLNGAKEEISLSAIDKIRVEE